MRSQETNDGIHDVAKERFAAVAITLLVWLAAAILVGVAIRFLWILFWSSSLVPPKKEYVTEKQSVTYGPYGSSVPTHKRNTDKQTLLETTVRHRLAIPRTKIRGTTKPVPCQLEEVESVLCHAEPDRDKISDLFVQNSTRNNTDGDDPDISCGPTNVADIFPDTLTHSPSSRPATVLDSIAPISFGSSIARILAMVRVREENAISNAGRSEGPASAY
jgi:hypothetical protein